MRIKATVEYNGKNYQGWQKQVDAPTVQETIEQTISKILNQETVIYASGRTDTGVHARGQVFHFDVLNDIDLDKFRYSLNRVLPEDIYIRTLEIVDNSFHSRYSVKDKIYTYRIHFAEKAPLERNDVYCCPYPTNIEILKQALSLFVGKHNFKNLTSKEEDEDNFVREIYSIDFKQDRDILSITFDGDGFMRYMIRNIVGVSLAVAQGKESYSLIENLFLEGEPRNIVSYKAPACGLTLEKVNY